MKQVCYAVAWIKLTTEYSPICCISTSGFSPVFFYPKQKYRHFGIGYDCYHTALLEKGQNDVTLDLKKLLICYYKKVFFISCTNLIILFRLIFMMRKAQKMIQYALFLCL